MVSVTFISAFSILRRIGFFDIILPVILVYSILYGVLDRVKLFTKKAGDKEIVNSEINSVIAFAVALLTVGVANVTGIISTFLPYVGLISILLVCFMMLTGLIFGDLDKWFGDEKGAKTVRYIMLGVTTFAFIFAFGFVAGWWDFAMEIMGEKEITGLFSSENISVMIFILILLGIVLFVTNSAKPKQPKQ